MAKHVANSATLEVDLGAGDVAVIEAENIEFETTAVEITGAALGDEYMRNDTGTKNARGTLTLFYDPALAPNMGLVAGIKCKIKIYPRGESAGAVYWTSVGNGNGDQVALFSMGVQIPVDQYIKQTCSFGGGLLKATLP